MSKRGWLLGALAALVALPVAAVGAAALLIDPNAYKAEIVQAVQDATGRTLTLRGPLSLSRSLWPTLEVTDVTLANLPGGTRPDMARAERIEGQISLLALLRHQIEITKLTLIGPNILFEQVGGRSNWVFTAPPDASSAPAPVAPGSRFQLRIRNVYVRNGMVTWRLPARTKVVGIRSLDLHHRVDRGPLELRSTLVYSDNQPFTLNGTAQPTGRVMEPWTAQLQFAAFDTTASATGMIDVAGHYDLQVEAISGSLEKLNALLPEMQLPTVHQATLSTHVTNGDVPGDLPVVGATKLRFAGADLRDRVPGLTLGAVEASLPAAGGQAVVAGDGNYNDTPFKLQGAFGVPTHPDGPATVPVELKVESASVRGSLALNGKLKLATLRFAGLETAATLRTPALAGLRPVLGQRLPALTDVRFDGQLSIPAGPGPVQVKAVKLLTKQGDMEGDGTVGFDAAVILAGTWHADNLDLDAVLQAFGIDLALPDAPSTKSGPMIPDTKLPWAALQGPTLDLTAAAGLLKFQDQLWHSVQFALKLKGGRLQVGPLKLALPAGPFELSMTADGSAAVNLSLQAPTVPLALIARYAGLPGPAAGTAQVKAQLNGAGQTVRAVAASLNGPFSIAAVNGQFSNAALIKLTSAALEALGITVPAQGQTRLVCLGIAGAFAKGVATFRTIALETSYLSLDGVGQVDLARETVAFKLNPLAQVAGAPVSVPVVVEGPFRAIKGRLDATGLERLGFLVDALFGGDTSSACAKAGLGPRR